MPGTVFISYSHADEVWKDRLVKHLNVLEQQGLLRTWDDRNIKAGDEWFDEIQGAMAEAQVAVLLISADSLTSEFILHSEVPRLLERRSGDGLAVFPVICEDCVWQEVSWLARLQVRPKDGKPLESFQGSKRNAELVKIAKEILSIVRNGSSPGRPTRTVEAPIATAFPTLHQLPSPPADFTGRKEELASLRSSLAEGGTGAIFGFRGMGGVGKTTLALKLAEELTPRYPDAQIYLDLKGVDPQPLTATQAMAHVIRSFHPEVRVSDTDDELTVLYRSVLHGKRCLLLMDNASPDGRSQIGPLRPPPGSLLLVTSRFHFYVDGMVSRDLDELPEEDARRLLLKIASRIGDQADEIARLCGRLPLALRLAGGALAEHKDLSPDEYVTRLKQGTELDPVETSLALSYDLLEEDRQRLWRQLMVFPGTFDAPAAASVWTMEVEPAKKILSSLVGCSLVEWEESEQRYRLHDLARQFADRRLGTDESEDGRRRHAEHYLEVLGTADSLYEKGGEAILLALRLFDSEWANVQAGFTWATERALETEAAARVCNEYPDAGKFLLQLRQPPKERVRWREQALAAARKLKDRRRESHHLAHLGIAYADLGETRRAIELFEQRLAIAREIGDRRGEGYALGNLGNAYAKLGETRRAIELYEQQLAIVREIGDRRGEENALGNMGLAYRHLGESRRAIELHEQDLAIAREIGDRLGEAQASWNMGLAVEDTGDLARAVDLMQVCVDFEREIGHPDAEKDAAQVAALRARLTDQGS